MKTKCLLIMIVCAVLFYYPYQAFAAATDYFTAAFSAAAAYPGETVRITLSAHSSALMESELPAAFRTQIPYDSTRLHFLRVETTEQIQSGAFQYYDDGECVTGVYACDGLSAPRLNGDCIRFVFSVAENADPGTTNLTVQVDQIADWNERLLPKYDRITNLPFSIKPSLSQNARLQKLVPSAGKLKPEFSPDVAEYDLRVGADISTVKFQANAEDGGTVRINRQTLQRAGETTEIVVTVTAEDKKSKSQYLVRVNRAESLEHTDSESKAEKPPSAPLAEKQSTSKHTTEKTTSSQKGHSTSSSKASKSTSKSTSSKTAKTSVKSTSSKSTSSMKEDLEEQTEPTVVQADGTRNLYIVGGQSGSLPIWIMAFCVMVLTALVGYSLWNRKGKQ